MAAPSSYRGLNRRSLGQVGRLHGPGPCASETLAFPVSALPIDGITFRRAVRVGLQLDAWAAVRRKSHLPIPGNATAEAAPRAIQILLRSGAGARVPAGIVSQTVGCSQHPQARSTLACLSWRPSLATRSAVCCLGIGHGRVLLLGQAGRTSRSPPNRRRQPGDLPAQTLIQIHNRRVQALPGPRRP